MAELADAHDSKSCEVTPHEGSTPSFGKLAAVAELADAYGSGPYRVKPVGVQVSPAALKNVDKIYIVWYYTTEFVQHIRTSL